MPLENEGNPEGLQLLRESLRKVQLESPDKVHLFICRGTETFVTRFIHNRYRKISFRFREAVNKLLRRFFPLRGYHSPPTPIAENYFAKKTLGGGEYLLPPYRKIPNNFLSLTGQKWPKIGVSDQKYLFFSGIGGYPPSPLNGKSSCPKTLSGKPLNPLTEKIR